MACGPFSLATGADPWSQPFWQRDTAVHRDRPEAGTCLHCTMGTRLSHAHSPQWTWGSAASPPRAWRGHWRGSTSQHIAHEAQPGSWGEGSGTAAVLKQVHWEQEAEAVSISLPPCPAVSPMSPILPDTCAESWHSIGALQNLLRAVLYFSVAQILVVPALDEEFPVWSGLLFLSAKPLFFQVLFRVGPFLLENKSLLTNSFQLKKHGQEQRSQISLLVFLYFNEFGLPLTVQKCLGHSEWHLPTWFSIGLFFHTELCCFWNIHCLCHSCWSSNFV